MLLNDVWCFFGVVFLWVIKLLLIVSKYVVCLFSFLVLVNNV